MPEGEQGLRVSVSDERGRLVRATGLAAWLRKVAPRRARGMVSIALVSDGRMRSLNRTYRRKDYATDVLSFPAGGAGSSASHSFLGDIAIAKGVAARQARDARHSFSTELRVLALHGLLHLIGYDHERDRGEMRRLEQRLLARAGIQGLLQRRSVLDTRSRYRATLRPFEGLRVVPSKVEGRQAQGRREPRRRSSASAP